MLKLQKNEEYKIRLMPNIKDMKNPALELKSTNKSENAFLMKKYFSYVLNEDKLDSLVYGHQIFKYIHATRKGFYGTYDGFLITENTSGDKPEFYYANEDFSKISLESDIDGELKKYFDVIEYEPINLFDIKSEYTLSIKTRENHGFLELYNIGLEITEPLYVEGDNKDTITSLWNNVETLNEIKDNYKEELIKENKDYDFLFGDESQKYYYDKLYKMKNEKEEAFRF